MIYSLFITTLITLSFCEVETPQFRDLTKQWMPQGSMHGEPATEGTTFFTPTTSEEGSMPATASSEVGRFGSSGQRSSCDFFIRLYVWDSCDSLNRETRIAQKSCDGAPDNDSKEWEYSHWYCFSDLDAHHVVPMSTLINNFVNSAKNDGAPSNPLGAGLGDDCFGYVDESLFIVGGKLLSNAMSACPGTDPHLSCVMDKLGKKKNSGEVIRIFWVCHDWQTGDYPWTAKGFNTKQYPPNAVATSNIAPTAVIGAFAVMSIIGGGVYMLVKRKREASYEEIYTSEV